MSKNISFNTEARTKLVRGLDIAANALSGTIGPRGRNAYIYDHIQSKTTNDGVTIAHFIHLKDPDEDMGAYAIRNVTAQQVDDVGDGTTTVAVLTQAIVHEGMNRPENPMLLRDSLHEAETKVLALLKKASTKADPTRVEDIAVVSAENRPLAKMIAEIIAKLGEKAIINVENSKTLVTDYEIVDGYEASVGYMSPHFVNNKKSSKAEFSDVPVIVTEKKIASLSDIAPIFEQFKKAGIAQCVIVCDDIDDSILGMLVVNKNLGTFQSLVVRATGDTLKDIAGATGARMVSSSTGVTFQTLTLEHLGHAKKVVSDVNKTLFLGDGEASKAYAAELESGVDNEPNQYLQKRLKERIGKLRGGIAILRVAAPSDSERGYLKDKAEDAVKAVLAALEEGVVPGGGMALYRIAEGMKATTPGEEILKIALKAPFKKICENAGKDYTEIAKKMPDGLGYDAKNDAYVNMDEAQILDPTKVTRCALMNAISTASSLLTTFVLITEAKEDAKNN